MPASTGEKVIVGAGAAALLLYLATKKTTTIPLLGPSSSSSSSSPSSSKTTTGTTTTSKSTSTSGATTSGTTTTGQTTTTPPAAATLSFGTVGPSTVTTDGILTLTGAAVTAGSGAYWRLALSVLDTTTGKSVAVFPAETGAGQSYGMILSSSGIQGVNVGDSLSIVGILTTYSNAAMTRLVGSTNLNASQVALVSNPPPSVVQMSAACQSIYNQYNAKNTLFQAARFAYAANPTAANKQALLTLGNELDALEVQYGQNNCTVTLP